MAQNYPDVPSTETLQASRQKLLDRDDAVASCFSGTTFPTAGLTVGMLCLRTDESKLYQLRSTGPDVWVQIADLSKTYLSKEEAQALFAAIGHNHDADYQPKDNDLTAISSLTATGLIERTGDGLAQTVPVTTAGKALLDDADAAAQRATLGLGSAATANTGTASGELPAVQADGKLPATVIPAPDLSDRVAKTGDTMTGELVAPTVKSGGSTALDTGFKLSDGTDVGTKILRTSRQSEYADNQVANCQGLIPNGNCYGDPNWQMPDANWWTWGLGLSPGNPNGYDFAGGSQITYQPVPTVNAGIYGSYYLHHDEVGYDVNWRDWNNCNCGPTNCYSNCNCNCNCNCDCDCDCGDA